MGDAAKLELRSVGGGRLETRRLVIMVGYCSGNGVVGSLHSSSKFVTTTCEEMQCSMDFCILQISR